MSVSPALVNRYLPGAVSSRRERSSGDTWRPSENGACQTALSAHPFLSGLVYRDDLISLILHYGLVWLSWYDPEEDTVMLKSWCFTGSLIISCVTRLFLRQILTTLVSAFI
jgi:hypothetical protein